VVTALRLLNVPIQTRDVQIELTNMVDEATAFARNRVPVPDEYLERPQFLDEFRETSRLGKRLSSGYFEQFFTTIVLARYRYLEERYLEDLVSLNPLLFHPSHFASRHFPLFQRSLLTVYLRSQWRIRPPTATLPGLLTPSRRLRGFGRRLRRSSKTTKDVQMTLKD
jgi:hypothetical protein